MQSALLATRTSYVSKTLLFGGILLLRWLNLLLMYYILCSADKQTSSTPLKSVLFFRESWHKLTLSAIERARISI